MTATTRSSLPVSLAVLFAFPLLSVSLSPAQASPKPDTYWQVDDVRPGMKGKGATVMKGTKLESFDAVVLGVLKNTSPGRDLVLCRLSGLGLEKTGIIAGMSGSPVTIDGKLLGAVAYAWAYGTEPIAGVTPFSQMHGFVEAFERRDLAEDGKPRRIGLKTPLTIDGLKYDSVTVSQDFDEPQPSAGEGLRMVPLRTPLAGTGFTAHSLGLLRDRLRGTGLVPMNGGGTTARVAEDEKDTPLVAGGALAVSLITGDFDLSGIGTVTHVEGNRVYGWGHPFMSLGSCELPLMTGYIHCIYPRLSVSFKMGSPLRTVGVINADVSTGIAGWLERKPDMIPVQMKVRRDEGSTPQTFNVQIARQHNLLPSLVFTALTNSVDMEGDLPDEMTALLEARIEVEGHAPVVIKDTYSGSSYSGGRAPQNLYSQVAGVVSLLVNNPYKAVRIKSIECDTQILTGRRTADIEAIELESDVYSPGDTLRAVAHVRPYKGALRRLPLALKLPVDLSEGNYTATVCDDLTAARADIRDNPLLSSPPNTEQIFQALAVQTAARRTNLVVRLPVPGVGVALGEKALPNLPPSMVAVLGSTRKSGAQTVSGAVVARHPTEWVLLGSESIRFVVSKNKKTQTPE
jgi:hypothetical protein